MSIYAKLADVLAARTEQGWKVSFSELERLIGMKLPASAFKYPAWWSNNPSNNAMTKIWLKAGWRTEQVDIQSQTVVFRRVSAAHAAAGFGDRPRDFEYASARAPETKMARPPGDGSGVKRDPGHGTVSSPLEDKGGDVLVSTEEFLTALPKNHPLANLFGFLKGTITLAADFDPCAPAYTPEEWKEAEAEMEAEWDELYGPNSDYAKGAAKGKLTP